MAGWLDLAACPPMWPVGPGQVRFPRPCQAAAQAHGVGRVHGESTRRLEEFIQGVLGCRSPPQ